MKDQIKIAEALKKEERTLDDFEKLVEDGLSALGQNLGHRSYEDIFCEFTIDLETGNLGYVTYGMGETTTIQYRERHATLELYSLQRMNTLIDKGEMIDEADFASLLANNMWYQYRQAQSLTEEDYKHIEYLNNLHFSIGENGEIFMGEADQLGFTSAIRRPITMEMQSAMVEWFLHHKANGIGITMDDGQLANILFTTDSDKLQRIIRILKEE